MKIVIDITEDEISTLRSCIEVSENEGYEEDEAREVIRKLEKAVQESIQANENKDAPTGMGYWENDVNGVSRFHPAPH